MSRWFRFHAEALDDPKVQKLDGETFKAWVNLLCLAARNGGRLPAIEDIAFGLRMDVSAVGAVVERLLSATLLDKVSGGRDGYAYAPHGWDERQYKSDTSTDRVKRFRKRSKPDAETAPEAETEAEESVAKATGGEPPDLLKAMFDDGLALLTSTGTPERQARSLLGKWKKAKGEAEVLVGLADCRTKRIEQPVEWLEKRFRAARYVSASGYEYRGDFDAIEREAKRRHDMDTYWQVQVDRREVA